MVLQSVPVVQAGMQPPCCGSEPITYLSHAYPVRHVDFEPGEAHVDKQNGCVPPLHKPPAVQEASVVQACVQKPPGQPSAEGIHVPPAQSVFAVHAPPFGVVPVLPPVHTPELQV